MSTTSRRGWRERLETGVYRSHRLACPSSSDRRPGRRCACPYDVAAPTGTGRSKWITVDGTLADARKARARAQATVGTASAERSGQDETLRTFAARWLRTRSADLRPATLAIYNRQYRVRIDPHLGHRTLEELTRSRVQEWIAALLRTDPRRRSIELAVGTLSTMLSAAVEDGVLLANPAKNVRMPRRAAKPRGAERVLTREQAELVLAHAGSLRNETILRVMLEAGLRRGEAIGLRWPQVDLPGCRITVSRSVWQGAEGERVEHVPKGGRTHVAAVSADLSARLADWLRESVIDAGADAEGLVWPGEDGRALAATSVVRIVYRAQKRAGLLDADKKALVTAHGLRHTAASTALAAGVPLLVVSRQLGHSDQIVTARHYSHLLADEQLDAFAAAQGPRQLAGDLRGTRGALESA
jgi:integrase